MGRFFRLSQYTSNDITLGEFYDFGMDQGKSFYISQHGVQNQGLGVFKKMFTISPQDFVGVNLIGGKIQPPIFIQKEQFASKEFLQTIL